MKVTTMKINHKREIAPIKGLELQRKYLEL